MAEEKIVEYKIRVSSGDMNALRAFASITHPSLKDQEILERIICHHAMEAAKKADGVIPHQQGPIR